MSINIRHVASARVSTVSHHNVEHMLKVHALQELDTSGRGSRFAYFVTTADAQAEEHCFSTRTVQTEASDAHLNIVR